MPSHMKPAETQSTDLDRVRAEEMLYELFGGFELEWPDRYVPHTAAFPRHREAYKVVTTDFCSTGKKGHDECWYPGESLARLFCNHGVDAEFIPSALTEPSRKTAHYGELRIDALALRNAFFDPKYKECMGDSLERSLLELLNQKHRVTHFPADNVAYLGTIKPSKAIHQASPLPKR